MKQLPKTPLLKPNKVVNRLERQKQTRTVQPTLQPFSLLPSFPPSPIAPSSHPPPTTPPPLPTSHLPPLLGGPLLGGRRLRKYAVLVANARCLETGKKKKQKKKLNTKLRWLPFAVPSNPDTKRGALKKQQGALWWTSFRWRFMSTNHFVDGFPMKHIAKLSARNCFWFR